MVSHIVHQSSAPVFIFSCAAMFTFAMLPFTSSFTIEAMASGAVEGTFITRPSEDDCVFRALPFTNSFAESTLFFRPGTSSFPSFGQSNTDRYRVVLPLFSFLVHLPHDSGANGLATVA